MTTGLRPTQIDRRGRTIAERLLVTGREGTQKTSGWISIAKMAALSKSPAQFWVIDTDFAADVMLADDPGNIGDVFEVHDWESWESAAKKVLELADDDRGDWVVLDRASEPWSFVQDDASQKIWGMSIAEYREKNMQRKAPDELPWNQVNSIYHAAMHPILLPMRRFHVYATASAKKLGQGDKEHAEAKTLYGSVGEKADGQKDLGSNVHTVIHTASFPGSGQPIMKVTTLKDRMGSQRKYLRDHTLPNTPFAFCQEYLIGVAGWTVK